MTNKWKISEDQIWYCETVQDLKNSPITTEIINFTSKNCWSIIDIEWEEIWENVDSSIEKIYIKFISNKHITPDEQQLILWFLDDPKALKMAQNIFSKLKIPQCDDNKLLFDSYLKNTKWYSDITNFVEYLKCSIKDYPLITRSDISDLSYQKTINEIDFYTYKCADWTNSIFVITEWKIVYLDKPLSKIQVLNNWLIFWTQLNLQEQEGEDSKEWIVLEFDGIEFIQIYNRPWLDWLFKVDIPVKWYGDLYKTEKHWQKWLIEFSSVSEKEWKENIQVREIIEAKNENLICHSNWFITTTNVEQILDWEEDIENFYRHTTYAKATWYEGPSDGVIRPVTHLDDLSIESLQHLKRINKWPISELKQLKQINEIITNSPIIHIKDLWDYYYLIQTWEHNINVYKFLPNELSIKGIPWLEWISYSESFKSWGNVLNRINFLNIKNRLLLWEPSIIKYTDWKKCLCIFDKEKSKLISLITATKTTIRYDSVKDTVWTICWWQTIIFYLNDWKIYIFKKWLKYVDWWYIKKTGVTSLLQNKVQIKNTYGEMKEYLEEIKWPIVID